jgi:hypothetical protein
MRKFILAAMAALPLTVFPPQAMAGDCCTPLYRVGISIGLVFRGWCGCDYSCCKHPFGGFGKKGGGHCCSFPGAGPWYGHWPYPAHFQHPAPTGYPFWPPPLTWNGHVAAPMGHSDMHVAANPQMQYYANPMAAMPPNGNFAGQVLPAAYQNVPSYWYDGR